MIIYFDSEFTGLHQNTTLVSIGFVTEYGDEFYAEFNDFDKKQVDEWLEENVISNLQFNNVKTAFKETKKRIDIKDSTMNVVKELTKWLKQFDDIEIWSDCLSYDWVLFNQLFGHAFNIPKNIYYIPFDLSTAFKCNGIDPDISREEYAEIKSSDKKHNALWDAQIIKKCCVKLGVNKLKADD